MILYFLKSTMLLGLFYVLYMFALRNSKSFTWNRLYLLITSFLALLIPLLPTVTFLKKTVLAQAPKPLAITLDTFYVYAGQIQTKELDYAKIFLGIYVVGFIWGLLRMILGFIVIHRVKIGARLDKINKALIYFNQHIDSPFSFNKNIYIPAHFKDTEVLSIIIKHEQAHVQLNHSLDKIYFSMLQAICWINPFVYLYHREIELVHEFEADEFSTQEFSTDDYVENLLKTIQYTQTPTLLAHHFFQHPLKTRITMLYKNSTQTLMGKAISMSLTAGICLLFFMFQTQAQNKQGKHKFTKASPTTQDTFIVEDPKTGEEKIVITQLNTLDSLYETADEMPQFANGKMDMNEYIMDNLVYPEEAKNKKIEGKVLVDFSIDKQGQVQHVGVQKGADIELGRAATKLVYGFPKWKPAMVNGKPVNMKMVLPVVFKLK